MALSQGAKTRKKTAQNQFEQRWFYLENLLLERRQMFTELSGIICNNFTARKVDFVCHMLLSVVVTWSFIYSLVPDSSPLVVSLCLLHWRGRRVEGNLRKPWRHLSVFKCNNREFTQRRRRRLRKRHSKSEFGLPQTLSRLFHLV